MQDVTFIQAQALKTTLAELLKIKADLSNAATQSVIMLVKRKLPPSPPAALTEALASVESFLLAQAVTAIQDQIDASQTSFDELQDAVS